MLINYKQKIFFQINKKIFDKEYYHNLYVKC